MSIEKAMIARAKPKILNAKLKDFVRDEVTKGCRPEISTLPVPLEPPFMPLWNLHNNSNDPGSGIGRMIAQHHAIIYVDSRFGYHRSKSLIGINVSFLSNS